MPSSIKQSTRKLANQKPPRPDFEPKSPSIDDEGDLESAPSVPVASANAEAEEEEAEDDEEEGAGEAGLISLYA